MAYANLAEMLTGKSLGLSRERLDIAGWTKAFRNYSNALPDDQLVMEFDLANEILTSDDWLFIADAIHLARSLRMRTDKMRDAIGSAVLATPNDYKQTISRESELYFTTISRREGNHPLEKNESADNANDVGMPRNGS